MPAAWGWRIPQRIGDPRMRQVLQSLERYLVDTDGPAVPPTPDPDPPPDDPPPPDPDPDPPPDPDPDPNPDSSMLEGGYGSLAVSSGGTATLPSAPTSLGSYAGDPLFSWDAGSRECTYLGPNAANLRVDMSTVWFDSGIEGSSRTFTNQALFNGAPFNCGSVSVSSGAHPPTVTGAFIIGPVSTGTRLLFRVTQGTGFSAGVRYTSTSAYSVSLEA